MRGDRVEARDFRGVTERRTERFLGAGGKKKANFKKSRHMNFTGKVARERLRTCTETFYGHGEVIEWRRI